MAKSIQDIQALLLENAPNKDSGLYFPDTDFINQFDISSLIQAIESLSPVQKLTLLKKETADGKHFLIQLAIEHPDSLPGVLAMIDTLPYDDRNTLLAHQDKCGRTAITFTRKKHPDAIKYFAKMALDKQELAYIGGDTYALSTIAKYAYDYLIPLLPLISKQDFKVQRFIYNWFTPHLFGTKHTKGLRGRALDIARIAFGHAETQYRLKKLKDKIDDLHERIGLSEEQAVFDAWSAMTILYHKLQTSYDEYLSTHPLKADTVIHPVPTQPSPSAPPVYNPLSPPTQTRDQLVSTWRQAIADATPTLAKHRGCKEILFRIGISPGLLFYHMYNRNKPHGFFPAPPNTESMNLVEDLEKAFQTELTFNTL